MESVLVANRGEIAVRVIRAAKELGLRTIAVYSELDRNAIHVQLADEAWNIGPAPAGESYLNIDRILEVAKSADAAAIHPGYGFLAENALFAQAVLDEGIIWVGPSPDAITTMGDKIASRVAVAKAGVTAVPGTQEPLGAADEAKSFAAEHGYPIAIKAAHGGGGKGLRVVYEEGDLETAFDAARREADAYFSRPEVYVEKYLEQPRHIEAQIICDAHGNAVFVGERDCSAQRRHQKLVEETPAPGVTDLQREKIAAAALAVARATNYESAGTVEFLMSQSGEFFFLEMNTRIQVEHTITEAVTGIDLVKEQLRIAAGDPLSFTEATPRGHAIEFRINAEDPSRNFMPNPGTIVDYREPGGPGVRVDSGVAAGSAISQYYDNLIAKLVVWGRDRDEAICRGRNALKSFQITGLATTIPAHLKILDTEGFTEGGYSTRFVEEHLDFSDLEEGISPHLPTEEEQEERSITVEVGGRRFSVKYWAPVMAAPAAGGQKAAPRRRPPKLDRRSAPADDTGVVAAPMQGTIVKVHKSAGDSVKEGEPLCVLEAMKMENEIKSPKDGEIIDLRIQPGDTVTSGTVLMVIK
ncbi:MAG: acetyl-CoA carboxylase biotin carboxylase subunit [Acidimicrobiia bacterium]|nr:acetyl-CoA carboxylase biotin carboxylase subunit [Acidimicrobiia bacterium]MDX2465818.1 acetyl-CoA carboxylase biotin carboxylase subunit [Acidimicrobiia bacterium]